MIASDAVTINLIWAVVVTVGIVSSCIFGRQWSRPKQR